MWDGDGQPLVLVPAASALSMGVGRGWGRCTPLHADTCVGLAFSYMHSSILPHGPAPVCAHLGSLSVELGVQDMPSGSRRPGEHPRSASG